MGGRQRRPTRQAPVECELSGPCRVLERRVGAEERRSEQRKLAGQSRVEWSGAELVSRPLDVAFGSTLCAGS